MGGGLERRRAAITKRALDDAQNSLVDSLLNDTDPINAPTRRDELFAHVVQFLCWATLLLVQTFNVHGLATHAYCLSAAYYSVGVLLVPVAVDLSRDIAASTAGVLSPLYLPARATRGTLSLPRPAAATAQQLAGTRVSARARRTTPDVERPSKPSFIRTSTWPSGASSTMSR